MGLKHMTNPQPLIPLIEATIQQILQSNTLNSHKAVAVAQQINEIAARNGYDMCVTLTPTRQRIDMTFDMPDGLWEEHEWDLNSTQPPPGVELMIHDALTILLGEEEEE